MVNVLSSRPTSGGDEQTTPTFSVLGPVRAFAEGTELDLGGRQQRLVLALLLRSDGRAVSTETVIDGLWPDSPPSTARKTIQVYVHRLRKELGDSLQTEPNGYSIDTKGEFDVDRFEGLQNEGRELLEVDPRRAGEILREALGLWRGSAYADLADEPALTPEIARLENLRVAALGDRLEADLAQGGHDALIGELEGLTQEYPNQDRFRAQHMLALYRAGRQVEALRAFERLRRYLADELGLRPSEDLAQLERRILDRDDSLLLPTGDATDGYAAVRGYELRELVGSGPTTNTYRAYQRSVGREVAVRVLGAEIANDPRFIADFLTDTQLVASLEHPHVVHVFDAWREPGRAYQVSRWLGGGSLADALTDRSLDQRAAVQVLEQVGDALAYAHRHGVIHGKVTPTNVLFDDSGNAYLSDFRVGQISEEASVAADARAFADLAQQIFSLDEGWVDASSSSVDEILDALRANFATGDETTSSAHPRGRRLLRNPYKGLRAYHEADAPDFFGRDELVGRLVEKLAHHRLVAIVGPSGSGKSSVMKAGLAAHLKSTEDDTVRLVAEMLPGAFPFEELEGALLRVGVDRSSVITDLLGDERGLRRVLKRILPDPPAGRRNVEFVLMIDQFEELFSAVGDERTRSLFLDSIVAALADPNSPLRVVLTIRADFFDRPLRYPEFGALVEAGLVPVTMLDQQGLESAIAEPAHAVGLDLEPGLVPQILRDVGDEPGSLPLMQYALTELVEGRDSDVLTVEAYQRTGGVFGALGRRAEELYTGLDSAGQHALWQAFLRLISVDDGAHDVRRRVRRAELSSADVDESGLGDALALFGSHRLLTFDLDPITRGPTVEVAHEALLREWGRLHSWIDEHRDELLVRRRVDSALREWEQSGFDASYLPTGSRLAQFSDWADSTSLALTDEERTFLDAGAEQEAEAARRVTVRRRAVLIGLGCIASILAVVAAFAIVQRGRAEQNATRTETSRLAAEAVALADANPRVALLLAAEAHQREPVPATLGALQQVMLRTGPFLGTFGDGAVEVEWQGDRIIALTDSGLSVYDAATRLLEREVAIPVRSTPAGADAMTASTDGIPSVFAASADGNWAVVGVEDGGATLVDLRSGDAERIPEAASITAAEFSNDGTLLAVGTNRADIVLMGVPDLAGRMTIAGVDDERSFAEIPSFAFWTGAFPRYESLAFRGVSAIAFAPNDDVIASGFGPRVRQWSTRTGEEIAQPVLLSTRINAFPYFPQALAFVGSDLLAHGFETITRVDAATGKVESVAGLPSGRTGGDLDLGITVRFAGDDALAIVDGTRALKFGLSVTSESEAPTREFEVPSANEAVAVSPDGRTVVVGGPNGLLLAALDGRQLLAEAIPRGTGRLLSISSDGATVAATDGTQSQVFDLSNGSPVAVAVPDALRTAGVASTGSAASLGTHVMGLTAATDLFVQYSQGRALLYDGVDFDSSPTLVQNFHDVSSISPDGELLAHARCTSGDGFAERFGETGESGYLCDLVGVNVVEVATGELVAELWPPGQPSTIDWSADGRRLLFASVGGRVTAWSTEFWEEEPPEWGESVSGSIIARHSPDGAILATVGNDGVVRLKDPDSGRTQSMLGGSTGLVRALRGPGQEPWFSPDGALLLTAFDGSIRLWDTDAGEQIGEPFPNDAGVRAGGAEGSQLRLATGVRDHILVWNLDTDTWFDIACRAAGSDLTLAEWDQFGPTDAEHRSTCAPHAGRA